MRIVVQTPATVGNFGPGFDAFALALHGEGDRVELRTASADSIFVEGPGSDQIPTQWDRNVAGVVVDHLRNQTGSSQRYEIRIRKRRPGGSGLGSSASSSGGAAVAYHLLNRNARLSPEDLVRAAGEGESVAAGRHYDDVAAVVLGGLAIVRVTPQGLDLARVQPPKDLHLAVVAPRLELLTKDMRRVLPDGVPRDDAVKNIAGAAQLIDAFHRGDIPTIGSCLDDRIATPARRKFVPFFELVRTAALRKGAYGVALSGSGPAMIGVCDARPAAQTIANAMKTAVETYRFEAEAFAAQPEREVVCRANSLR